MELKITKILTALFGTTILTLAATDKAWAEGKLTRKKIIRRRISGMAALLSRIFKPVN